MTPVKPVAVEKIVPLPPARPVQVAAAMPKAKPAIPAMALASLSSTNVFDNRGYWRGAVESGDLSAPTAATSRTSPFELASAEQGTTGSGANAAWRLCRAERTNAAARRLLPTARTRVRWAPRFLPTTMAAASNTTS